MRSLEFLLCLTVGLASASPAAAQQFAVTPADGFVLPLSDGRLAVLQAGAAGVTVRSLIDADSARGAPLDLAAADVVTEFAGMTNPTLEQVTAAFERAAVGSEIVMTLRRNGAAHTLRFPRPAPKAGARRMAVSGAPGQAPGAWVTAGQPSDVEEMQIAGARIRNNGDGLPEVVARGSHPAAAAVPLRTGDVIVSVNGKSIAALAGLELFYQPLDAGAEVTLVVRRSGREETVRFRKPNDR